MENRFLFLGTGGSAGIPMIGCKCPVCLSKNPKNQRMRPSLFLEWRGKRILIDTGPDLRFQALRFGISDIDGVIITHTHFDHIGGLDELRTFYLLSQKTVPLLLSKRSLEDIQRRMGYLFAEKKEGISLPAQLDFQVFTEKRGVVTFLGEKIRYTTYEQGGMEVNGFRFDDLSYISDIRHYSETLFEELKGTKTLILSALRKTASPMHLTLEEAVEFAERVGAEKTYFMHIAHEMDHDEVNKELPEGIELGFDGMEGFF